jgi:hypothetical protein
MSRRDFLTSSALLGAATAALAPLAKGPAGWFQSAPVANGPTPSSPVRILRADAPAAEAFERGVRATLQAHGLDAASVGTTLATEFDFDALKAHLTGTPGAVLVGLVPERLFLLVNELARESGARLLLEGTHLSDAGAHSRHTFTTTAASAGVGAVFADGLKARNEHALVQETVRRQSARNLPAARRTETTAESWSEALGQAVAHVATGQWRPSAVVSRTRVGAGDAFTTAMDGYVSFVCVS